MFLKRFRQVFNARTIACMLLVVFLAGCQISFPNLFGSGKPRVSHTPEGLYSAGVREFDRGRHERARSYFTRVKEEYPLHEMAILARIGIADSFFNQKKYMEAEAEYADFLTFHPTNENVPYAIYQIGMCYYNQIGAIDRDQSATIRAKAEFERLLARFPESKFSTMGAKMLRDCNRQLAEHEFYVGQFYFKQKKYQAALMRFETIAREYANVGLDYKVEYFINETKARIAEEEGAKRAEEEKASRKMLEKKRSAIN